MMRKIIVLLLAFVMMVMITGVVVGQAPASAPPPTPTPIGSIPYGESSTLPVAPTSGVPAPDQRVFLVIQKGATPSEKTINFFYKKTDMQAYLGKFSSSTALGRDLDVAESKWFIDHNKDSFKLVITDNDGTLLEKEKWTAVKENLNDKGAGTVETITYSDDKTLQHYTRTEYGEKKGTIQVMVKKVESWKEGSLVKEKTYLIDSSGKETNTATILEKDSSGKPIHVFMETDNKITFMYDYDKGELFKDEEGNYDLTKPVKISDLSENEKKAYEDIKSFRREYNLEHIFSAIRFYGTEYTGLGGWSSLFIDEKDLQEYRDTVQDYMCKSILFGGIDCWTSEICETYADVEPPSGVLLTKSASGELTSSAHIEATRSYPATFNNGTTGTQQVTEFVYTLTYAIQNANEDELSYNIVFFPRNYRAFRQNAILKQGESANILLQQAIVQPSKNFYNKVCLVFNPGISDESGEAVTRVCNTICGGVFDPVTRECNPLETAEWQNNEPNGANANNGRGGAGDFNDF